MVIPKMGRFAKLQNAYSPSVPVKTDSPEAFRIFLVEDDPLYMRMLDYLMRLNPDHEVHKFTSGRDALANLHLNPSVVILDYQLPDMNGLEVLRRLKQQESDSTCIVLSGQQDINVAVDLLKNGAFDYVTKNDEAKERILNVVQHVQQNRQLQAEVNTLKQELTRQYEFEKALVGQSEPMKQIYALLQKASGSDINVSIFGETGTGKEVAAKAIHYNSRRARHPFVAVNMAAIPPDLLESELFGHEKGAFTGALARRRGKFEQADKGTIFLDEIGEMDISLQAKLLRVLQERELVRVGGEETVRIDCRIIVATNRNLAEEVAQGNFRQDLYYRLLGLSVYMPPLRHRGQDILLLAKHFLDNFTRDNRMQRMTLLEDARRKLMTHPYHGNVRELRASIELAAVMSDSSEIKASDITFPQLNRDLALLSEELTLDQYTFKIVRHFLKKYNNNVVQVALKLGIGKSTLYRMLKEMPLED